VSDAAAFEDARWVAMLANLFGLRRDRFTLVNLRRLTDVLRVTPASGFSRATSSTVVETFREIAELMIYGDQHDPSFFDVFVEQRVMAHFTKFLTPPGGDRADRQIVLQLLQTLAIVIQNIREETSLFFLFSEQHVSVRVVQAELDFHDEEVMARYVSLLKTISLRLNQRTVQMFFLTGGELPSQNKKASRENDARDAIFPLFASGVSLLPHHDSMVRASARTVVLNCLAVNDKRVRKFLTSPKPWGKCVPQSVKHAGATVAALTERTLFAKPNETGARERGNLVAELSDLLSFVDDVVGLPEVTDGRELTAGGDGNTQDTQSTQENTLAKRAEHALWEGLIAPTLLESVVATQRATKIVPGENENETRDAGPPRTSPTTALFAVSRVAVSCRRGNTLRRVARELFGFEPGVGNENSRRPNARRVFLLKALAGIEGAPVAAAAIAAAASLARATADEANALAEALRDVGLAPPDTKRNETETGTGTETERSSARGEICDALAASLARIDPGLPLGARRCAAWLLARLAGGAASTLARASIDVALAAAAAAMRHAIDGPWGDAAVSTFEHEWGTTRRETTQPSIRDETVASWIREAASSSDPRGADPRGESRASGEPVREESAAAASAVLRASRELALLVMLGDAMDARHGDNAFPSEPPARVFCDASAVDRVVFGVAGSGGDDGTPFALAKAPNAPTGDAHRWMEIREGTEMGFPTVLFPCRVAFEAGRERSVFLVVAARSRPQSKVPGVAAAALLLEALPNAGDELPGGGTVSSSRGVVRAVAPLGACDAFIDPSHKKWLRVRVRSPYSCLAAARKSPGSSEGSGPNPERLSKKLRDGHWTLAFPDEETCAAASDALENGAKTLRAACRAAMAPVLMQR
jgi:hypothetical protein|tara:strand:- start:710 stop:3349 length:2640 start_codon:yes stop_codon:yes gene_type:complete